MHEVRARLRAEQQLRADRPRAASDVKFQIKQLLLRARHLSRHAGKVAAARFRAVFPERRIFIRSGGRQDYLVISPRFQVSAAVATSAAIGWVLFSSLAYFDQKKEIAAKDQEIAGLQLAYQTALAVAGQQVAKLETAAGPALAAVKAKEAAEEGPAAAKIDAQGTRVAGAIPPKPIADADGLKKRINQLEAALGEMQSMQSQVMQRLSDVASSMSVDIEKAIGMAGLEVGKILPGKPGRDKSADRGSDKGTGKGGPYVPPAMKPFVTPEFSATLAALNIKIDRSESASNILQHLPLIPPLHDYKINSRFGIRSDPFNDMPGIHEGVDLGGSRKSSVMATAKGRVIQAAWKGRYGRMVEIDHGNGIRTRYAHLDKILVNPGQKVDTRTVVGLLGNSGRSSGPHLHYEILVNGKPRDPLKFIKAGKNVYKTQAANWQAG